MTQGGLWLLFTKLLLSLGVLSIVMVKSVQQLGENRIPFGHIVYAISTLLGMELHYLNHVRSRRPSSQLCSGYLLYVALFCVELYSAYVEQRAILYQAWLIGLSLVLFLLENRSVKPRDTRSHSKWKPEFLTFLSKILFLWVVPWVLKVKRQSVDFEDMWEIPSYLTAQENLRKIQTIWDKEWDIFKQHSGHSPLKSTLMKRFGPRLLFLCGTNLISLLRFANPIMLDFLIRFMNTRNEPNGLSIRSGVFVAFGYLVLQIVSAILTGQQFHYVFMQNMTISQSLKSLIYTKALQTPGGPKVGKVLDLISTDAAALYNSNFDVTLLSGIPLELGIGFWMLYHQVGWSFLVFVVMLVLSFPIADRLGRLSVHYKKDQLEQKDIRVTLCNDAIDGMKPVKLYGWSEHLVKKILVTREKELQYLKCGCIVRNLWKVFTQPIHICALCFVHCLTS
jgi:ABC-type multidrug transport system fused ATPase/permease subunit